MAEGDYQTYALQMALTARFSGNESEPEIKQLSELYTKLFAENTTVENTKSTVTELLKMYQFSPNFPAMIEYNKVHASLPALAGYRKVAAGQDYTGIDCLKAVRTLVAAAIKNE